MADENENQENEGNDTIRTKKVKSSSEQKSQAFGVDIPGEDEDTTDDKRQDLEDKGGDEGVDLEEDRSIDSDTPVDSLAEGATGTDSDTPLHEALGMSPPDDESEPDSESESKEATADKQEPETDQEAEQDDSELDPELVEQITSDTEVTGEVDQKLVEKVQEDPVQVAKNLQQWQSKLTERSQALSDMEKLYEVYKVASKDPGRAEALQGFVNEMAEGRYDSDREIEKPDIDVPENVEGTEYEDTFKGLIDHIENQAEEINRLKRFSKQAHQQNGAADPRDLVGQQQEEAATEPQMDEIDHEKSVQEFEQFIEEHPGLLDENGEPTPELEQITQFVAETGVEFEKALYAEFGGDLIEDVRKSGSSQEEVEEKAEKRNPDSSELVDSSSGSSDQSSVSDRLESFMGTSSLEEHARSLRERASS